MKIALDKYEVLGNLTDVRGELTDVGGYLTDVGGNLDDCELTDEERAALINIRDLIKKDLS